MAILELIGSGYKAPKAEEKKGKKAKKAEKETPKAESKA